ncbi:hypothetical protein B0H12DRAFT_714271 [Mycena haematopus]|nr:hypothetical protein B0H12DRAFT_714271 [Mycena haematopus]
MIALPSPVPIASPDSDSAPAAGTQSGRSPKRQKLTDETAQSLDDIANRMHQQHPTPTPNTSHSYGPPNTPACPA